MKNICTIFLFLHLCNIVISKPVSESTASKAGRNFLSVKTNSAYYKTGISLTLAYKSFSSNTAAVSTVSKGKTAFYIFNTGHGFVIVSGDDAVHPILGYSNDGNFDQKNISPSMSYWLDGYQSQIQYVIDHNIQPTRSISAEWNSLNNNSTQTMAQTSSGVSPLMATDWNQSPYYNDLCPYDNTKNAYCVTGCVATAMAQVMKYWNFPTSGYNSYSYNDAHYGTQSVNFSTTTYGWSSMTNSISSSNTAVATLMYHCGVSVNMAYGTDESTSYVISAASATTNCAEYALKQYFGYSSSLKGLLRSNFADTAWISKLKNELDNQRPVIYAGFGPGGGHCFDLDGYDANNYFHVNWGWGGTDNGYFSVDALNPSNVGTGGGSGDFNSNQEAIIGIEPSTGGSHSTPPEADSISLYDQVTISSATIKYGQGFAVYANLQNTGTDTFKGSYCAAIFDSTNTFFDYVDSFNNIVLLPNQYYTSDISFGRNGSLSMLPGKYSIAIFYHTIGGSWKLVANTGTYTNYVKLSVINPGVLEMYSKMKLSTGTTLVQGQSVSVNLDIINTSTTTFNGEYDLSLYNLDGSHVLSIQTLTSQTLKYNYHYTSGLTFSNSDVNVSPGTYLLAMQYLESGGSNFALTGSTNYPNPIKVIVVEPALGPDKYEPNNTISEAYSLPVTFSSDLADVNTAGSNCNTGTDYDYYKIILDSGFDYKISGRIDDARGSGNSNTYTLDGIFSYSVDSGKTWNGPFSGVLTNNIVIKNGGGVYFLVSPQFSGQTGTYLLDLSVSRVMEADKYEPDNSVVTAYSLPVNFSGNTANVNTQGSNINVSSDVDYYKIILDPTKAYSISARIDDAQGSGNSNTYSLNGQFSYSLDGGNTWSGPYQGTIPSNINLNHGTTVYFLVTSLSGTETGTYLLDVDITKSISGIENNNNTTIINVYPNPTSDVLNIDLSGFKGNVNKVTLTGMDGKIVYSILSPENQRVNSIPVENLAYGIYFIYIQTDNGIVSKRIEVQK